MAEVYAVMCRIEFLKLLTLLTVLLLSTSSDLVKSGNPNKVGACVSAHSTQAFHMSLVAGAEEPRHGRRR
jgi:hypothetical protein